MAGEKILTEVGGQKTEKLLLVAEGVHGVERENTIWPVRDRIFVDRYFQHT